MTKPKTHVTRHDRRDGHRSPSSSNLPGSSAAAVRDPPRRGELVVQASGASMRAAAPAPVAISTRRSTGRRRHLPSRASHREDPFKAAQSQSFEQSAQRRGSAEASRSSVVSSSASSGRHPPRNRLLLRRRVFFPSSATPPARRPRSARICTAGSLVVRGHRCMATRERNVVPASRLVVGEPHDLRVVTCSVQRFSDASSPTWKSREAQGDRLVGCASVKRASKAGRGGATTTKDAERRGRGADRARKARSRIAVGRSDAGEARRTRFVAHRSAGGVALGARADARFDQGDHRGAARNARARHEITAAFGFSRRRRASGK